MQEETREEPGTSASHSEGMAYGLACSLDRFFSFSAELKTSNWQHGKMNREEKNVWIQTRVKISFIFLQQKLEIDSLFYTSWNDTFVALN